MYVDEIHLFFEGEGDIYENNPVKRRHNLGVRCLR